MKTVYWMMDHGKDLPPLTLSNTSVSCLVTLIPVLVSMTSHCEIPCYDDETDKPAWWPSDVEWRNPQFYLEDVDRKNDCLKVLRKLVYSCYSYHGVEELCRIEETPVSDSELESGENMEIIQLTEDSEAVDESSTESEGPVFVCCFCLHQFSSHDQVNTHQNVCSKRFGEISSDKETANPPDNAETDSMIEPSSTGYCYKKSFQEPTEYSASSSESESGFLNVAVPSKSSLSNHHLPKISQDNNRTTLSLNSSSTVQHPYTSVSTSSQKRPAAITSAPFVPTLKTRSQKRLDQIMEKHKSRCLMLEECRLMRNVPPSGAWWVGRSRRKPDAGLHHPNRYLSQDAFVSAMGLARATDVAAMAKKESKDGREVDLDCEIISVEGPLSAVPPPPQTHPPATAERTSSSPRSTRSLISQLGRDGEINTRRRLSFCFVEDEWADREALSEGRDPLQISLLTLDLSSPLGQRVKKYVRGEGHLNLVKDIESYCRTELDDDSYSKLRFRGCDFRVTYRKKRRASTFVHMYKFNRHDRLEFMKLLKTGLSANSRHIQQRLPVCKVVLNRLSESEIKLWTEEKKITISEQIVYDDDICITHIDIPESRITQGFTTDAHPPSQLHLHRKAQYVTHPSPVSAARQNTVSDSRLLQSTRMSASPPHVPNIFRNRTSFTSSPPHPSSISRPSSLATSWRPQQVTNKAHRGTSDLERSRFYSPSFSGNSSHQKLLDKADKNLGHLSGHKSLSPSTYVVPDVSEVEPKSSGELLGANRRKQLLTCVRKDEGDSGSVTPASTNRGFKSLPLNRNSSNSSQNGLMENHPMQKQNRLHSPSLPLQPSVRKLSNFDYFSIRDGKMTPTYLNNSHPVVNQHPPSTPLLPVTNPHNHQNADLPGPTSQHSRPHHHPQAPSPLSHSQQPHSRHNNLPQRTPSPARPSAILSNNNHPQQRFSSGFHKPGPNFARNQNGASDIRPAQQKAVSEKTLSAQFPRKRPVFDDDDIMEVICIEDD